MCRGYDTLMRLIKGTCMSIRLISQLMIVVGGALLTICACSTSSPEYGGTINWKTNLAQTIEDAKKSNKYVLVDVSTEWCGPCKKMAAGTFKEEKVTALLNEKFECVKIDGDDPDQGKMVMRKYDLFGYPTVIVLASDGAVKKVISGYRDGSRLLSELNEIVGQ